MSSEKDLIFLMSISLHFGGKNNIKHMRYIYREEHTVYVDYEIEIDEELLIERGISPYDDMEVSEFIKHNYLELQPESTEWWISAQEGTFTQLVGTRPDGDDSEESISWI
jgi:hypothetical protein